MTPPVFEWWMGSASDAIHVRVIIADQKFERALFARNEKDAADLRIAQMYMRHGDRAAKLGDLTAAITERCLAIERLFPETRDLLPA